jgi:hypothetical protein
LGRKPGFTMSPEVIEKIRNTLTGVQHTEERKKNISLGHIGIFHSKETKQKMSMAHKGKSKNPEHIEKVRLAQLGRKRSPEAIENNRQAKIRHLENPPPNCKCVIHHKYTKCTFIEKILCLVIIPDLPKITNKHFGRYSVDAYVPKPWHLAFEADGDYWHNLPGIKERDQKKDKYLLEKYNLPVIRFSESDLHKIYKEFLEAGNALS